MSRFAVVWWDDALHDLARLWMDSSDRDAINAATMSIDTELSRSPSSKGCEVSEGLRRVDVAPLRAYFVINHDDRRVEIMGVRRP